MLGELIVRFDRLRQQALVLKEREILLQVGYRASDAATAIEKVLRDKPGVQTSQELVQEVFRQRGAKT